MSRLKGFQKLTPVDEALQKFLEKLQINKPKTNLIPLDSALNCVLAEPIVAQEDLPRTDRSAVDGYAVKAQDTANASQFKPQTLTTTDKPRIGKGQAKQIWTGNPIPDAADAVVMLENTKQGKDGIEVWIPLTPGENVSKKGEDVKKGQTALEAGIRLKPQHLGMLAALGMDKVKVFERPRIAVFATGNELVAPGRRRKEDQIFDTNRHTISALCRELGAEPLDLGVVGDDFDEIVEKLKLGLGADAIITTGGTSVGVSDLVPEAINRIGKPGVIVHGVAMRPAMPTALAVVEGKPVVILSGNPVAAMIGFEVFARPLLCRMLGLKNEEHRPTVEAQMTRSVVAALGRRTFVRVRVFQKKEECYAEPVSARGSGVISTMTKSNGYVVVPENREGLGKGETVQVRLFNDMERRG